MKSLARSTVVRSPTLGLTAISLGFLMITLDATIVNVALGPIGNDLGGSVSTAQWIVNGYTLAFAALLLTAGALADRLRRGQRRLRGRDFLGGADRRACGPRSRRRGVDAVLAGAHRADVSRPGRPPSRARRVGWRVGNRPGRRTRPRGHHHCRPRLARDLPGQRADRRRGRGTTPPSRYRNGATQSPT
jgi:hypothetical protein